METMVSILVITLIILAFTLFLLGIIYLILGLGIAVAEFFTYKEKKRYLDLSYEMDIFGLKESAIMAETMFEYSNPIVEGVGDFLDAINDKLDNLIPVKDD